MSAENTDKFDDLETVELNETLDQEHTQGNQSPVSSSSIQPAQKTIDNESDILIKKYVEACQTGDLVTVKDLIESEAIELGSDVDENNVSGLHWAAINNRLSIVKYLVSKGAEVDRPGGDLNATPLHWACRYGLVYIVDYLLKNGADPTKADSQGFNTLHLAVHSSNIMLVIYVLAFVDQVPIDSADPQGRTALIWAGYQGDSLSVDALLNFNANVKLVDEQGFTALHWSLIRGQKDCIKRLIEKGSDIYQKTNDGKTCFDVAQNMNSTGVLKDALFQCGLDPSGNPITKHFSAKGAKIITFLTPYALLGSALYINAQTNAFFALIISIILFLVSTKILKKFIFPCYVLSSSPFIKSPYLSGIFSGTAFWILFSWIFTILPYTLSEAPLSNLIFAGLSTAVVYSFFKAMFKDPGIIQTPDSNEEIKATIEELLQIGKFDARNFCINTYIKKPLRSKYSSLYEKCVARYDHFCPWVYNDVGLRNHKVFMFFVISLELTMFLFFHLVLEYFDELKETKEECFLLDDDLCTGCYESSFIFTLTAWTIFQSIWVTFLLFSQFFQISKGLTTLELSVYTKRAANGANPHFSSAPAELSGGDSNTAPFAPKDRNCLSTFCLLTGIDQFAIAFKQVLGLKSNSPIETVPTDYGVKQNCIDFWFASGDERLDVRNVFKLPVNSEANLNGQTVDYYKLYTLPERRIVYDQNIV
ncbi:Palmitoyltransferase AKR1 [Wickerhamomyces ciferrii]|uniref:Palmitoyltransferase n=1 Tax=Wickerhamomyces ciferrii (strain ATCC 14091 / BCRC 22168 / CBS 111 / JCM 3599 / NBRC 0793 / NRRL Y-1031 F-60-10) TaxID=1206466 RepID=K0KRZ5_WICCF|nr:Palmitoyltransferase AKR1 [Wickerhamomyces ciferrii]CCH44104.1 Palmitoyltransferase AKR1 [Wickerhamomyces ciferrii]